ncbi:plasmid mobilization protein [Niabella hirudinis]|uniref:plasmid mobilization protein n=1 Tax=Niabella hirudinis TaxID=1285929 RepID=UPI003EBCABC4
MKTKTLEKATTSLHIRLRPSEKAMLLKKTEAANCSITEFVIQQVNNNRHMPGDRKTFITGLHLLSSEVHRIGVNINQVVHLMHQEKLTGHTHAGSLQKFNQLFGAYHQLLNEVRSLFQKIVSHEQAGI